MSHFDIEIDPLFPRVCAAGASLRRIDRAEQSNEKGERSIWHQGTELSELLSWEDKANVVQHQQLFFLGFTIEYRRGIGLRTGRVDDQRSDSGLPTTDLIQFDTQPVVRTLELGARLLREARRDYYIQHLLQQLNDALTTRFNRPQTQVYGLPKWRDRLRRASDGLRLLSGRHRMLALYLGVGAGIGAAITLALLALLRR